MTRDPDARHRRLAAIVFTDIVGYSAIVHRDEAAGARALDLQRRIVRRQLATYGGREIETAGDSFLLEFASPFAALRCVAAIQRELGQLPVPPEGGAPLQLRASLHVGDIAHRGREVFGDAVNIAARLLPLSPPGGLALSKAALGQLHGRLPALPTSLGACSLKNIAEAVEVFIVEPAQLAALPLDSPSVHPEAGNRRWPDRHRLGRLVAALVVVVGLGLLPRFIGGSGVARVGAPRIAVLPFATFSSGADDALLAAGLQDSILTNLARFDALRVISRTSVLPYKDPGARRLKDIAADLEVDSIIEGSLQRSGDRLMVQVQLIDAATDHHLWAQSYERPVGDLFGVQSAIARDVARAVKLRYTAAQQAAVDQAPTTGLPAWTAYQRALAARGERRWSDAVAAVAEALAEDSGFALALVLKAELDVRAFNVGDDRRDERLAQARSALIHAAELQPDLPELHRGWGYFYANGRFDLDAAIAEYQTALHLLPNDPDTLEALGLAYQQRGRLDEALLLQRRAVELAPRSRLALLGVFGSLEMLHRYRSAAVIVDRLARLDGDSQTVRVCRARLALAQGDLARVRALLPAITYAPALERFHYYLGEFDEAIRQIRAQPPLQTGEGGAAAYPVESNLAALHWSRGDQAQAVEHAQRAIATLEAGLQRPDPAVWDQQVALAVAYAIVGRAAEARRLLDEILSDGCCDNPLTRADILGPAAAALAVLGDRAAAIALLDRLLRAPSMVSSAHVRHDPMYVGLRAEPAFVAALGRAEAVEAAAENLTASGATR